MSKSSVEVPLKYNGGREPAIGPNNEAMIYVGQTLDSIRKSQDTTTRRTELLNLSSEKAPLESIAMEWIYCSEQLRAIHSLTKELCDERYWKRDAWGKGGDVTLTRLKGLLDTKIQSTNTAGLRRRTKAVETILEEIKTFMTDDKTTVADIVAEFVIPNSIDSVQVFDGLDIRDHREFGENSGSKVPALSKLHSALFVRYGKAATVLRKLATLQSEMSGDSDFTTATEFIKTLTSYEQSVKKEYFQPVWMDTADLNELVRSRFGDGVEPMQDVTSAKQVVFKPRVESTLTRQQRLVSDIRQECVRNLGYTRLEASGQKLTPPLASQWGYQPSIKELRAFVRSEKFFEIDENYELSEYWSPDYKSNQSGQRRSGRGKDRA